MFLLESPDLSKNDLVVKWIWSLINNKKSYKGHAWYIVYKRNIKIDFRILIGSSQSFSPSLTKTEMVFYSFDVNSSC